MSYRLPNSKLNIATADAVYTISKKNNNLSNLNRPRTVLRNKNPTKAAPWKINCKTAINLKKELLDHNANAVINNNNIGNPISLRKTLWEKIWIAKKPYRNGFNNCRVCHTLRNPALMIRTFR